MAKDIVVSRGSHSPSGKLRRNFVFVLTDGLSNDRRKTAETARQLHTKAQVVVIGKCYNIDLLSVCILCQYG